MIQGMIIAVVFVLAVLYIGKMFYTSLFVKKGCGSNCKCSLDISNIEPGKTASK